MVPRNIMPVEDPRYRFAASRPFVAGCSLTCFVSPRPDLPSCAAPIGEILILRFHWNLVEDQAHHRTCRRLQGEQPFFVGPQLRRGHLVGAAARYGRVRGRKRVRQHWIRRSTVFRAGQGEHVRRQSVEDKCLSCRTYALKGETRRELMGIYVRLNQCTRQG